MGYWQAYNVTLIDQAGNLRNQKNNDFGWRMYVNNPLEDLIAPAYVANSASLAKNTKTIENQATDFIEAR